MSLKKSSSYLSCLFFFKVAVGAILLATGWDSLGIPGEGLANITIIMALSFFPAAFARPLFKKLDKISLPKLLTLSLWLASALIIAEHLLMGKSQIGFFTVHFILWIYVFVIEVALEKWYVALSQNISLGEARKLSGISTCIGQIGIIAGPALVMWAKVFSQALPYWIILATFLIASTFSIKTQVRIPTKPNLFSIKLMKKNSLNIKTLYILGFSLIWPTLTVFNLSIPVLAKSQFNSIDIAGFLEMLIALATAIAGFTHSYLLHNRNFNLRTFVVFTLLIISTIGSYILNSSLIFVSIGIFLLGLSFGYLRVELRALLSKRFEPKEAGEIIASANSWSGLFIVLYATLFYFVAQVQKDKGLTLLFPISFILCAALFIYILKIENNEQSDLLNV